MLEKLLLRRPALRRIPTQELPVPEPERTPSAYEQMLARAYRAGAPLLPVARRPRPARPAR